MTTLTSDQTTDMLFDLAAGDLGDVFSQEELQRLYDRAGGDYNLAVYYGWRGIFGDSARWVDYKVAQTSVSRSQAAANILKALELWGNESRTAANQVQILGMNPVPTRYKELPADESCPRHGYFRRGRWFPYG